MARKDNPVWRALADPTRRRILDLLSRGPETTGALAARFPMSRIGVMKHLDILSRARLVTSRKRGRERWHYLNFFPLQEIHRRWLDPVGGRWAQALADLKDNIEAEGRKMTAQTPQAWPLSVDIALDVPINAPAQKVFAAITNDTAAWWGRPWLTDAAVGIELDARLGGWLREVWAGEGGALLGIVTAFDPDRRLEITGRLHLGVVQGIADFQLKPDGEATVVSFSHRAIGDVPAELADAFSNGWRDLLATRLTAYAERGERMGIAAEA